MNTEPNDVEIEDEPAYESPHGMDDEVRVFDSAYVLDGAQVRHDVQLDGKVCRITECWWDEELGWRYLGEPIDQALAEEIRRQVGKDIDPMEVFLDESGIVSTGRPFPRFG